MRYMVFILLIMTTFSVSSDSDIGYVTDMLRLKMYSDMGGGEVIHTLETADEVDILKTDGSYMYVRTTTGDEGWVNKYYVVKEAPGKIQAISLKHELKEREKTILALEAELEKKKLGEDLRDGYEKQLIKANQENVVLFNDKEKLRKQLDQTTLDVARLKQDLAEKNEGSSAFIPLITMVAGGLAGIIIGWILHIRQLRKRFYGYEV